MPPHADLASSCSEAYFCCLNLSGRSRALCLVDEVSFLLIVTFILCNSYQEGYL